jgi:hypothetical protein
MSIAITCEKCSARSTAPDAAAGRQVKCPKCGYQLTIPHPSSTVPSSASPFPPAQPAFEVVDEEPAPPAGATKNHTHDDDEVDPGRGQLRKKPKQGYLQDDEDVADIDRPQQRPKKSGGVPIWVWFLIGGSVLIFLAAGIVVAYLISAVKTPIADVAGPEVTMPAERLMEETKGNPAAAYKYQGKIVRLSGSLDCVMATLKGRDCFLLFVATDSQRHSPRCFFRDPAVLSHLKQGDPIVIQGELRTDGGIIDIGNCRLISSDDGFQSKSEPNGRP